MWDPLQSADNPDNGVVIAESTSDIAYFSLGDPFKGEQELIVYDFVIRFQDNKSLISSRRGDCVGGVSFFSNRHPVS